MRIEHGVAITLEDQIDALETAWHELSRIMLSSGFNWHHVPGCEEVCSFEDFSEYHNKIYLIWQKLEELKKERDGQKQDKKD